DEESLQMQLDNDIYISNLDNDNIEVELEEEIIPNLQNISFEEAVTISEKNLNKYLELAQKVKLYSRVKSDIWKYVSEETRKCSKCSKIFNLATATTSIQQFNDATIELSSQTYPTIAHVQIILLTLRNNLESEKDPRYKKYCFSNMTDEEILIPIRQKINQQLSSLLIAKSKKLSSFYQKLKYTSQPKQIINDEVQKYWLYAEADETIKLLDWWNTYTFHK
ncbi:4513_t:CDS:2, partial [Dentiscutata heterogama]